MAISEIQTFGSDGVDPHRFGTQGASRGSSIARFNRLRDDWPEFSLWVVYTHVDMHKTRTSGQVGNVPVFTSYEAARAAYPNAVLHRVLGEHFGEYGDDDII